MREQEWAAQSTQILDFLTKLERSVIEMQKEKRGYLLTGDPRFADAYRRATADFYTYHGYLSILVANSPEQVGVAERRSEKGVERWTARRPRPEMEAKRTGKDVTGASGEEQRRRLDDRTSARWLKSFQTDEVNLYEIAFQHGDAATASSRRPGWPSSAFSRSVSDRLEQLQLRPGAPAVGEAGRHRDAHPLHHREHSRRHDHGRRARDHLFDESRRRRKMFGCINNEMVGHKFTQARSEVIRQRSPNQSPCAWDRPGQANRQHDHGGRPHSPPCDLPGRNFV